MPAAQEEASDYMRDMYYSSQPMEIQDNGRAGVHIPHDQRGNAAALLLDYPALGLRPALDHHDLPFVSEKGKHNILGGTAGALFKRRPRNEAQKANLQKLAIHDRRVEHDPESGNRFSERITLKTS